MADPVDAALARGVAAERVRAGLTQAELGERLGWSRQTVTKIEAGDRGLRLGEVSRICEALGVGLKDLLRSAPSARVRALGL